MIPSGAASSSNGSSHSNGHSSKQSSLPTVVRSESMAYPQPNTLSLLSKLQFCMRQHSKAVLATLAFLVFVVILSSDFVQDNYVGNGHGIRGFSSTATSWSEKNGFGGAVHPGYFLPEAAIVNDRTFRFAAVTDMDQLSKVSDSKKPLFRSTLLPGTIEYNPSTKQYSIEFEETRTLTSSHNEAGRGMELSELTLYHNRLLAFDDRTGTVFEILNKNQGTDSYVVPRFVITEGDGDTDKGMKWEWATVKGGDLYMGSMGKEYTNSDGSVANTNNLWIGILTKTGELKRMDWTKEYNLVRDALGASKPGYLIHEAVLWSDALKKWVFLPRRVSSEPYNEVKDERHGSNKVVLVDEHFTKAKVVEIKMKNHDPLHGFSTFAFVPGTNDQHALAIRSVEEDCVGGDESLCKQRTYFMVFDVLTGEVLMDEIQYRTDTKYEGVEFVDIYTKEPTY